MPNPVKRMPGDDAPAPKPVTEAQARAAGLPPANPAAVQAPFPAQPAQPSLFDEAQTPAERRALEQSMGLNLGELDVGQPGRDDPAPYAAPYGVAPAPLEPLEAKARAAGLPPANPNAKEAREQGPSKIAAAAARAASIPTEPAKGSPQEPVKPKVASAVDKLLAALREEQERLAPNKAPGVWDIIEAASAGWQGQTPAYVKRLQESADKRQKLEELARTAELERELQGEKQAAEATALDKRLAAERENALISAGVKGLAGLGGVRDLSAAQKLAASLMAALGED